MVRSNGLRLVLLLAAAYALPRAVYAEDVWTEVAPGIDHLHRTAPGPHDYHVVLVDLTRPEIFLRATGPGENGQRTSSFAASVGATVTVNGDLWDADNWSAYEPLGLAVGDGWGWRSDTSSWSFLACDPSKQCSYDPWGHLAEPSPRWWTAIGGMQDLLVIDGVPQSYAGDYYAQRHPRTASGLTADRGTLILLTVDGRRSQAIGMSFAELTAVMMEFGAHDAINHDGGGSTTLVIGGAVQNVPSDGGERVVANHLAVSVSDHVDPSCVGVENSKQCVDATQFRTCIGGIDRGLSDCGFFGLTCETDGLFAFCVDPRCVNGGQSSFCLDDTRIAICEDGVYHEGDCAGFGLPCVEGFDTAWCWADFYQASPSASSLGAPDGGALVLAAGASSEIWFELENTGLATWIPGTTMIAPLPRDAASPFAAADWVTPSRAATLDQELPPGSVGRFSFTLRAPSTPGNYEVSFGLVQEAVTWFGDPPGGGGPADGVLGVRLEVVEDLDTPPGEGGAGGTGAGDGAGGVEVGESDCGCKLVGAPARASAQWAALLALGLLTHRRTCARRRSRAPLHAGRAHR
jgi:hypothetical protein